MAVIRWDPWGDVAALQRDVNEMWNRTFGQQGRRADALVPPIDAYQAEDALHVRMELPGMQPGDVEISVADGTLTVSGERRVDEKVEEERWVRRERAYGRFERSFTLPRGTDPNQITASFEHGILELRIPHPPERQPRKIQIAGSSEGQQQTVDVDDVSRTS